MRLPTGIHGMLLALMACSMMVYSTVALAVPVSWTDWTSTTSATVSGTLTVGSSAVGVTFSGPYFFAQTSGGTNYWNPAAPYISAAVDNAPPASDIIALDTGGLKTITFSQPVQDPLLALVSWNSNTVDFGVPIDILSFGCGFFGCGTPILNGTGTGFFGSGEVHGTIRLPGVYSSITFTDSSEFWHGLTVGAMGLPSSPVPEPSTWLLMGTGLLGLLGYGWRRRKQGA